MSTIYARQIHIYIHTYNIWYVFCFLVDCLLAGLRWNANIVS